MLLVSAALSAQMRISAALHATADNRMHCCSESVEHSMHVSLYDDLQAWSAIDQQDSIDLSDRWKKAWQSYMSSENCRSPQILKVCHAAVIASAICT